MPPIEEITDENVDKPVDETLLGGGEPDAVAAAAATDKLGLDTAPGAEPKADDKPAPAATAEDPAAAAAAAAADAGAAKPERDGQIPRARFDEVNGKLREERERAERLEAENAALKAAKAPPAADAVDVKALEREFTKAVFDGDEDKAVEIREKINDEIKRQAIEEADTRATERQTKRESDNAYTTVYNKAVADHPFLDPKTGNQDAIAEALEWRDFYMAKGQPSHVALENAVNRIAPTYTGAPAADAGADAGAGGNVTPIDKRTTAAVARGVKDGAAQPATNAAGVGNRAVPAVVQVKTQEEWEKLPESERNKQLA